MDIEPLAPTLRIRAVAISLRSIALMVAVAATAAPMPGRAQLGQEGVFETVAPSVFVVAATRGGKVVSAGSGVVVDKQIVVTNCHVFKEGSDFEVRRAGQAWVAYRTMFEAQDLCLVRVPHLVAPAVKLAPSQELKVGGDAYSIGAPAGLELTIAKGLVSGRGSIGERTVIQTTAPISRGSSGGGLFDARGRLIGITTFDLKDRQTATFVVPAEAVLALVEHHRLFADDIEAALKVPDHTSPPERTFATEEERAAFLQWLNSQSERLKMRIGDANIRIEFLKTLDYEASRAGIDRQLALALVDTLSGFRKYNVSVSGSRGFLAVPAPWLRQFGGETDDLFKTRVNLRSGLILLRMLLDANRGDLFVTLNEYADRSMQREPPRRDAQFPDRVLGLWKSTWNYDPETRPVETRSSSADQNAVQAYPSSTEPKASRKASNHWATAFAIGHILGSVTVVVAIGMALAFTLGSWLLRRNNQQAIDEVSIALGVPPERLDDDDIVPKVFHFLGTRYSDDRLQNRLADLFGSLLILLTWFGVLLQVLILGAVLWYTFTNTSEAAVYAWLIVAVELVFLAIGLVASICCRVLTGRTPGQPKGARRFLAGEIAKRHRSMTPGANAGF